MSGQEPDYSTALANAALMMATDHQQRHHNNNVAHTSSNHLDIAARSALQTAARIEADENSSSCGKGQYRSTLSRLPAGSGPAATAKAENGSEQTVMEQILERQHYKPSPIQDSDKPSSDGNNMYHAQFLSAPLPPSFSSVPAIGYNFAQDGDGVTLTSLDTAATTTTPMIRETIASYDIAVAAAESSLKTLFQNSVATMPLYAVSLVLSVWLAVTFS